MSKVLKLHFLRDNFQIRPLRKSTQKVHENWPTLGRFSPKRWLIKQKSDQPNRREILQ